MGDTGSDPELKRIDAALTVDSLPGPRPLPLVGNLPHLDAMHFPGTLERWAREYGPRYKFRLMNRSFVVTALRDDINYILHERPQLFKRTARSSDMLAEVGARGLFTAEGEEWRKQRKLVMHALTPEVIHRFFPHLIEMTERLRLRWLAAVDAGQPVNLLRDLKAYALDVTVALAMGHDINTLEHEDNPLQRDIEFLFNRVARRLMAPVVYWRTFKLPVDREADAAMERVHTAVSGFLAHARARMAADPGLVGKPSNMLEALLAARDAPDSGCTDETVIGNAIVMVFAGEDTTSNTIAWLLHLLSGSLPAMGRLAGEADTVLGAAPVVTDYQQLNHLPWLDAALREAMRLKPVAPVLGLEPTVDLMLGDLKMPAGMVVFLLNRHAFTLDGGLTENDGFMPERWLDGYEQEGRQAQDDPSRKLLPFGAGPRFCPGRYLATTEIRMVVSMLARNFTMLPLPGALPVEEVFTFTMTPSALPVRLYRREL